MYRLRQLNDVAHFSQQITFEALTQILPQTLIERILEGCSANEERTRKLPAVLTVWLVILMHLFSNIGLQAVLVRVARGSRLLAGLGVEALANKASISKARYRLGSLPLQCLFEIFCQPLATPETKGAFQFGLRLVAIDSTLEHAADTPDNLAFFGTAYNSLAFPLVRCLYLCECGTHAIFDAIFSPFLEGDKRHAVTLLRSVTADMLVMWDRGLYTLKMVREVLEQGSHVLCRLSEPIQPEFKRRLRDGSFLALIFPTQNRHQIRQEAITVRVLEYTFHDPNRPGHGDIHRLLTTLLDPIAYPARDLICLYHERWEIELVIDEIDTHQRLLSNPLRSHQPEGIIQELYGVLIAHYLVRAVMHQSAQVHDLDPDQLSFINAVRLITDAVADFQLIMPELHPQLWQRLLSDLAHFRLPPRDNRINPRVLKKKQSKYLVKRPQHEHPPQPARTFRESVVLLKARARTSRP